MFNNLRKITLGGLSSLALLFLFNQPAQASNWRNTGVTSKGETVSLDLNSIIYYSRYDVQFRYLIGKDVVSASVNCESSLVKPNIGAPFVPNLTGATRNLINIVCGRNQVSPPTYYAYRISPDMIASVRRISFTDFAKYQVSDEQIENDLNAMCRALNLGSISTRQLPFSDDYLSSLWIVAHRNCFEP